MKKRPPPSVLFRPEEIHLASSQCRVFAPPPEWNIRVTNRAGRIDGEDLAVTHPHLDWLTTVKARTINSHFVLGEEPADCQRLKPSLPAPALASANRDQVLAWQISEWSEGFDAVRARTLPHAGQPHIDQLA